jgi:hypothetical protein
LLGYGLETKVNYPVGIINDQTKFDQWSNSNHKERLLQLELPVPLNQFDLLVKKITFHRHESEDISISLHQELPLISRVNFEKKVHEKKIDKWISSGDNTNYPILRLISLSSREVLAPNSINTMNLNQAFYEQNLRLISQRWKYLDNSPLEQGTNCILFYPEDTRDIEMIIYLRTFAEHPFSKHDASDNVFLNTLNSLAPLRPDDDEKNTLIFKIRFNPCTISNGESFI